MRCLSIFMFLMLSNCSVVNAEKSTAEYNKKMVTKFYEEVLFYRNADVIDKYIGSTYIQHNPRVPDGKEALRSFIKSSSKRSKSDGPTGEIVRAIAEGDLVVLHVKSYSSPPSNDYAVIDIFRVAEGKIVEHWDVMQAVPDTSKNSNTMF